jgi:hypothetical protein
MQLKDRRVSGEHASIYFEDGHWRIRDLASSNGTRVNGVSLIPGERHALLRGDRVEFGSSAESWELVQESPPHDAGILDTSQVSVELFQTSLTFRVSADGEDVEVTLSTPRERVRLGQRAFTDLLLFLAQARMADQKEGLRSEEQGWVAVDALVPTLYPDTDTLNLNIFRARKQVEGLGIGDANSLVERRVRSRRVRLGVEHLRILRAPSTVPPDHEGTSQTSPPAGGSGEAEAGDGGTAEGATSGGANPSEAGEAHLSQR